MKRLLTFLSILCTASAHAQSVCDSLDIQVGYSAFYDSVIEVSVINHSQRLFDYPGFILYDTNGDTIAKETVSLFGIGTSSSHALNIYPGMPPASPFSGLLELYTGFFDSLECSYTKSIRLCPDTCQPLYPYFSNMGSALITANIGWELKDDLLQTVASGTFALDANEQSDEDTVCLAPGIYTLEVAAAPQGGGQPYIGVNNKSFSFTNPVMPYLWSAASLGFDFFKPCMLPTGVAEISGRSDVHWASYGGVLRLLNPPAQPLQSVMVYSMEGRRAYNAETMLPGQTIDLSTFPDGVYMIGWVQDGNRRFEKISLNHF